jgi:hypothetical protein
VADTYCGSRRTFLANALATLGALSTSGCQDIFTKPLTAICPNDPAISDKSTPLTIDVHAHVFNASDLQISRFLQVVVLHKDDALGKGDPFVQGIALITDLVQELAWYLAPSASKETDRLRALQAEFAECNPAALDARLNTLRQEGYVLARSQLQTALEARRPSQMPIAGSFPELLELESRAASPIERVALLIRNLPPNYADYRRQRSQRFQSTPKAAVTFASIIDFVVQSFQYRFVSAYDYLRTYSAKSVRKIDLLVPSMVDFDWWLADGGATASSLSEQIVVMKQIAIATGGRVHGFVPFCPLREIVFRNDSSKTDSSLAMAKHAIEECGFIGVKLYPTMGFAPYGNAALDVWNGRLPASLDANGFGAKLDAIMKEFFEWCIVEQVPVMAHTNTTNGPNAEFEDLTSADHWQAALESLDIHEKKLRVNFGHFGDTALGADATDRRQISRAQALQRLMRGAADQPGAMAYADAAFFVEVLDDRERLKGVLRELLRSSPLAYPQLLGHRLMYGTDWLFSLADAGVDQYLTKFEKMIAELQDELRSGDPRWKTLVDNFLGRNAATFLGLRKGEANRARLDGFYAANSVQKPDWMLKLDDPK